MLPFSPSLEHSEYLAIEDAIAATTKGRAFLRYRDQIGRVIAADTVSQMVCSLKDWIAGEESAPDRASLEAIRLELRHLRTHIDDAKAEIAGLVADGSPSKVAPIHGAAAELDEIVSATARATHDILSAAEAINGEADKLGGDGADGGSIAARCMDIYQACCFQDITGQRIAKVVSVLGHVEQRVNAMLAIGAGNEAGDDAAPTPRRLKPTAASNGSRQEPPAELPQESLLNGPSLPGHGLDQSMIDALLHDGGGADADTGATGLGLPDPNELLGQSAIDALMQ